MDTPTEAPPLPTAEPGIPLEALGDLETTGIHHPQAPTTLRLGWNPRTGALSWIWSGYSPNRLIQSNTQPPKDSLHTPRALETQDLTLRATSTTYSSHPPSLKRIQQAEEKISNQEVLPFPAQIPTPKALQIISLEPSPQLLPSKDLKPPHIKSLNTSATTCTPKLFPRGTKLQNCPWRWL